jgi:hypothetical protein
MMIGGDVRVILRINLNNLRVCSVGTTDKRDVLFTPLRGHKWHDVCIPSFRKIGTGVQAILRFCLSNFKGCNVGITDKMYCEMRH